MFTFDAAALNSFSFVWLPISQRANPCETPVHSLYVSSVFFSPTTIPSDQFWFHSVPNDDTLIASPLLTHVASSSFLACALHALLPSHDSSHRSTALRYDLAVSCFLLTVLRHKICCSDTFSGARFLAMSVRFARSLTPCTFCVTLLS